MIRSSENSFSVKALCKAADVLHSEYYTWTKAAPLREVVEEQDQKDFRLILETYKVRGNKKGAESIYIFDLGIV